MNKIKKTQDKKEQEKSILLEFQKASKLQFQLLSTETAKKKFTDYNGENPDFIILNDNVYIGVELFQLSLKKSKQLVGYSSKTGNQIMNLPHLESKNPRIFNNLNDLEAALKNPENFKLVPHDNEQDIFIETINDKLKKLDSYKGQKIWFLGYATEHYQKGLVENIYRDGIENEVKRVIFGEVQKYREVSSLRLDKIFLFETGTSCKDFFFEIALNNYEGTS